ncbi:hypothetical protein BDZ89DRAFT_987967 [Hymenopellis radicata]|nr:hypothetical protein BDZ89DRAFT_987967 [Hymenopellis radicata]
MRYLGYRLGGASAADSLIRGQGVSLILKSIQVQFRRPVTYPDTLLIAHRPVETPSPSDPNHFKDPSILHLRASAYSLNQRAYVAHTDEVVVWYDYDKLRKCVQKSDTFVPFGMRT